MILPLPFGIGPASAEAGEGAFAVSTRQRLGEPLMCRMSRMFLSRLTKRQKDIDSVRHSDGRIHCNTVQLKVAIALEKKRVS